MAIPLPMRILLPRIEPMPVRWGPMALLSLAARKSGAVLLGITMCGPCVDAMAQDDITELKHAIEQLQAQNRELTRRLNALEAGNGERKQVVRHEAAPKPPSPEPMRVAEQPVTTPPANTSAAARRRQNARQPSTSGRPRQQRCRQPGIGNERPVSKS